MSEIDDIRRQVMLEIGMGYKDHTANDWARRCKKILNELDRQSSKLNGCQSDLFAVRHENTELKGRLAHAESQLDAVRKSKYGPDYVDELQQTIDEQNVALRTLEMLLAEYVQKYCWRGVEVAELTTRLDRLRSAAEAVCGDGSYDEDNDQIWVGVSLMETLENELERLKSRAVDNLRQSNEG